MPHDPLCSEKIDGQVPQLLKSITRIKTSKPCSIPHSTIKPPQKEEFLSVSRILLVANPDLQISLMNSRTHHRLNHRCSRTVHSRQNHKLDSVARAIPPSRENHLIERKARSRNAKMPIPPAPFSDSRLQKKPHHHPPRTLGCHPNETRARPAPENLAAPQQLATIVMVVSARSIAVVRCSAIAAFQELVRRLPLTPELPSPCRSMPTKLDSTCPRRRALRRRGDSVAKSRWSMSISGLSRESPPWASGILGESRPARPARVIECYYARSL